VPQCKGIGRGFGGRTGRIINSTGTAIHKYPRATLGVAAGGIGYAGYRGMRGSQNSPIQGIE
jgi:hypothetical protein